MINIILYNQTKTLYSAKVLDTRYKILYTRFKNYYTLDTKGCIKNLKDSFCEANYLVISQHSKVRVVLKKVCHVDFLEM